MAEKETVIDYNHQYHLENKDKMENNPQGWRIEDIRIVCKNISLDFIPPVRGSHYKLYNPILKECWVIPRSIPIKKVYIKILVSKCREHCSLRKG